MKRLKLDGLLPGMVTAEDVYNYNDQLILPKGLILTTKAISKLQFYGIYQIRVEDEMAQVEEEQPIDVTIPADVPAQPAVSETPVPPVAPETPAPVQPMEQKASVTAPVKPAEQKAPVTAPVKPAEQKAPAATPVKPAEQKASVTAPVKPAEQKAPAATPVKPAEKEALVTAPVQPAKKVTQPSAKAPAPSPRWEPIKIAKDAPGPTFTNTSSSATSYMDRVKESSDFKQFKQAFDQEVQDFKSKINEVVLKNAPLDVNELLDDALNLIPKGQGSFSIFDLLHSIRQNDDETYAHCLNVGLFCNVFAGWLKLSEENTRLATLCGLLHDVGKMKVPETVLKKPGVYTEEEVWAIKKHAYEGYQLVRNLDIDNHIKNAVLTHHERCDGSGYPFGLKGNKIDPYSKMVAIADVYDAMTSPRPYRNAMSPFQAVEIMQQEGLQKYDVRFIMTFLENVMNTFIGNRVLLSTGEKGEIVYIHKNNVTRPTVKCGGHYVDMDIDKNIQIVAML